MADQNSRKEKMRRRAKANAEKKVPARLRRLNSKIRRFLADSTRSDGKTKKRTAPVGYVAVS